MLEDLREKLETICLEKIRDECVFCKMMEVDHEKIVFKDEKIAVFPPLKSGALKEAHLLVVPRDHVKNVFELNQEDAEEYFSSLKEIADKLIEESRYSGVNLLSANGKAAQQSIDHLHTYLVFREPDDSFDLWPETGYTGENFEEVNNELEKFLN